MGLSTGRGMQAEAASGPSRKRRSCYEGPFPVRVRLLGGFGVWVGPLLIEENQLRLRKAKSLIKLLALAPGHRLHREQVMETLWPELGVHKATKYLKGIMGGCHHHDVSN